MESLFFVEFNYLSVLTIASVTILILEHVHEVQQNFKPSLLLEVFLIEVNSLLIYF